MVDCNLGKASCEYDIKIIQEGIISICGSCKHGVCVGDLCQCDPGWFGMECDIMPTVLSNAQRTDIKPIGNSQWHYYVLAANHTSLLSIILSEAASTGEVWLYLSKENYPTLNSNEASNTAPVQNHRMALEFIQPKTIRFVIGVYGSPYVVTTVQYSLVAFCTPF